MKNSLTKDCGPKNMDHGLLPSNRRPLPPGYEQFGIRRSSFAGWAAFSLIEILVTIALLTFIILGLFAMFNQTQRAFTSSMTQSDVLEAGRAATDMLARDLERTIPSDRNAVNFYTQIPTFVPLTQSLPGAVPPAKITRTNFLQDCFVLTRSNQTWIGVGYCVRSADAAGRLWPAETANGSGQLGVGSLYRFTASTNVLDNNGLPSDPGQLYTAFQRALANNPLPISNRVCDGVVHFFLRASAPNGFPIFSDGSSTNALFRTNAANFGYGFFKPAFVHPNPSCPDRLDLLRSWSNAVPAYLEFEFGLIESRTLARYNSIGDRAARLAYLQREEISTRVHLFRQRIPVRNVDPAAFP